MENGGKGEIELTQLLIGICRCSVDGVCNWCFVLLDGDLVLSGAADVGVVLGVAGGGGFGGRHGCWNGCVLV